MADRVGQQLGNYRLVQLLGQGGFAEVYLGVHIHLGTQAAIKVLYTLLARDDIEQFRTEARTIARLVHPHIVRVLDFGVEGTTPFLVMDYAPNGTLRQRHPKKVPLPLTTVVSHVKQVADALQYAHNEKLIHRDVKPENMLLGRHNEILLSDFGIALVAQSSRYQQTQDMAGTIAYMAPEQIQAHPRPASDQYSLGIVVYEWLSGDRPFHGSFTEIAVKHSLVPPPSLRERVPTLPPAVEQVVMIALAKEPRQRFASVQAFATALEQASNPAPGVAILPSQPVSPTNAIASLTPPSQFPQVTTPPSQPSLPPGVVPPARQTSLSTNQVPPAWQSTQSTGRDTAPNLPSQTGAVPPVSTRAIPPPALPSSPAVAGRSMEKIRPRAQLILQPMLLLSLVVLLAVVIAGGGFAWFVFSHGPGPTAGGTTGSNQGGTSSGFTNSPIILKIATELPVSGQDESSGKPAEDGAHLAIELANAHHTVPNVMFQFVPKDDVGPSGIHDPAVGAQNVTALVGDAQVVGIVGPFNSSVAKAEIPISNQAPLAQISPANTNPCLTKSDAASGCSGSNNLLPTLRPTGKVNYFRIATTDDHQGPAGADYLYKTLNLHSAYVIDDAETYGVGLANAFINEWRNLGGTVLGHSSEASSTTASTYVSLLTQVASLKPDVIYFGGLDSTGGILIRQQMPNIHGLENTPFAGGDGIVTPTFATTIGTSGAPNYGTVAVVDTSQNPSAATFKQQFAAAFTDPINVYSAAAYDCANILIQAVKIALANGAKPPTSSSDATAGKAFREAVISAIQGIDFTGVTGHQSFDSNGDTTDKIITIYKLGTNATTKKPDWLFASSVTVA